MCAKHYIPVSSVPLFPITIPPPPSSPLFPYTTLFRSRPVQRRASREMPAAPDQRDAIVQRPRLILPELVRRVQPRDPRSEEHTSELQSPCNLVCRLLLEKKKNKISVRSHNTSTTTTAN